MGLWVDLCPSVVGKVTTMLLSLGRMILLNPAWWISAGKDFLISRRLTFFTLCSVFTSHNSSMELASFWASDRNLAISLFLLTTAWKISWHRDLRIAFFDLQTEAMCQ